MVMILRLKISEKNSNYNLDKILINIRNFYAFIYIPVESKSDDFLKLETSEMQKLMNKDILETIENVLNEKIFPKSEGKRPSNTNLVTVINNTLNNFMDDINSKIKVIDEEYSFKVEDGYKKQSCSSKD